MSCEAPFHSRWRASLRSFPRPRAKPNRQKSKAEHRAKGCDAGYLCLTNGKRRRELFSGATAWRPCLYRHAHRTQPLGDLRLSPARQPPRIRSIAAAWPPISACRASRISTILAAAADAPGIGGIGTLLQRHRPCGRRAEAAVELLHLAPSPLAVDRLRGCRWWCGCGGLRFRLRRIMPKSAPPITKAAAK